MHPKQFKMLPVFVDELDLWLLTLCLCAKAVRLGSDISECFHVVDCLKVFAFPKCLSEGETVLETILVF